MKGRRLWIVDPSVSRPETQGVSEILRGWRGSSRLFQPCLVPGDGPGPDDGYETDGVVIMGSAASVHDAPGWMRDLAAWLEPLLDGGPRIPVLGICFGHQLVAHLAGGQVEFIDEDRRKVVGVAESELRDGGLVAGRRALRVVCSHREIVTRPPVGYRVTATRPESIHDGLVHASRPVWSFQFHPEAREDFARSAGFDPAEIDQRLREDSQQLLGAFRRAVDPELER